MVKKFFDRYPQTLFVAVTVLIIILDQLTKWLILTIKPNLNLKILSITLVENTGAGFGLLQGQTKLLGVFSLIVALLIIGFYKKFAKEKTSEILFAMFLGGVLGNFIDRFFRGYVIDFINFNFWPAFNLADTAISVAAIGLAIYFWRK